MSVYNMSNTSVTSDISFPCNTSGLVFLLSSNALFYYLGISILASLMTLVTILLNCTFLASMLHQKQMRKSISNKLLMALSLNDLLQGTLVWPLIAVASALHHRAQPSCITLDLIYFLAYHLGLMNMTIIFLVALEQYIAILHPYFYVANVTFYRLVVPMLLWTSIIIVTNISLAVWSIKIWMFYTKLLFLPLMVMTVAALVYMHTRIIICAAKIASKITGTNREEGKQIKSRAKAAKSGLIVLIATLLCYSSIISYNIYTQLREPTPFATTFVQTSAETAALFTSVVDPAVYYWRLKSLRNAAKAMFQSMCKNQARVQSGD